MIETKDLKKIHLPNEGKEASVDKRIVRRKYGANGHGYLIDGVKADGVTGILSGSLPKGALVGWAAGAVGGWVFDEPQAVEHARSMGREGFIKLSKEIPTNDRDTAARRGTEVHKLAELAGRGEEVEVPDELAGHFDEYLDFRETWGPTKEMFEIVVAHLTHKYGGTLDTWAHLELLRGMEAYFPEWTDREGNRRGGRKVLCDCKDECLTIIDTKTSRSGVYSETGLQICAYGNATHYIDAAGQVREMPEIRHYVSLWLRSDGWDLIPFDIMPADFRTFLYCQQVSHFTDWKKGRSATIKGEALALPRKVSA